MAKHKHIADCVKDHALDFVAITEAGKRDSPTRDLDHFSCGLDYEWHVLPPTGRSGGILLGINSTYLQLLSTSKGYQIPPSKQVRKFPLEPGSCICRRSRGV